MMKHKFWQVTLFLISCTVYVLVFIVLHPYIKSAASSLGILAIAAAAALWGLGGGLLSGVLVGLLTILLLSLVGDPQQMSLKRGFSIMAIDLACGVGIGWLLQLHRNLRVQTTELIKAQTELHEIQAELETRVRDRTQELHTAYLTMKQSGEQLQLALEAACMSTWEWNSQTGQISWHSGAAAILGMEEKLLPRTFEELLASIHPDDAVKLTSLIDKALADNPHTFEFSYRVPFEQEARWIGGRGRVYRNALGQVEHLAGTISDITIRKEMENNQARLNETLEKRVLQRTAELQAERDFARQIMESLGQGLIIYDLQGQVEYFNPVISQLLGYSMEQLSHKTVFDITIPEDHPMLYAGLAQRLSGRSGSYEVRLATANGDQLDIMITATPRWQEGKIVGGVAIITDLTERKQAEVAILQAKEAAEAATQAKSAFLATMSHEIRTPLNGIIGMTELVRQTSLPTPEQRYLVDTIYASSQVLLAVINDLLDFSKIEAGKLELEHHPFHLRDCVETVLEMLAFQAAQKNLELVCQVAPEVPHTIIGDEVRLRQVLANLVGNAVKFTSRGAVVVTVTAETSITLSSAGTDSRSQRLLRFEVQDSGIGIPPEQLDQLFQAFTQLDASTTRRYGGTGLGLAISKSLVEMMGGRIWAASTGIADEGATFTFTVQVEDGDADPAGLDQFRALSGKRVLSLSSSAAQQEALKQLMQTWGTQFCGTTDRQAACELVKLGDAANQPFDLLIIDLQPPETGLEAAVGLHSVSPKLPIILLATLYQRLPDPRDREIAAFVNKPFQATHLYETAQWAISGQSMASPLLESPVTPGEAAHPLLSERMPLRILVVEDNPINQQVTVLQLQQLGFTPELAKNGLEALTALQRRAYDLVFMDLQMPEMDGITAARRIIAEKPGNQTPYLVAMTAGETRQQRQACLDAGMKDFLSKPVVLHSLRGVLERAISELASSNKENVLSEKTPVIDMVHLEEYAAAQRPDGQNMAQVIINLFLEELPGRLESIHAAIQQDKPQELKKSAHQLKGSCRSVGLLRLGEVCERLEEIGQAGQAAAAAGWLEQLESSATESRQALAGINFSWMV